MKNLHNIRTELTDDQKFAVIRWNKSWEGKRKIRIRNGHLEVSSRFSPGWAKLTISNAEGWTRYGRRHHTIDEFREDMLS